MTTKQKDILGWSLLILTAVVFIGMASFFAGMDHEMDRQIAKMNYERK